MRSSGRAHRVLDEMVEQSPLVLQASSARERERAPHAFHDVSHPWEGAFDHCEVCDVCFQNMNTSSGLSGRTKYVIIRASVLWQFGTVSLARSARSPLVQTVTGPLRPCPSRRGASPRLRPCRKRSDGCATMTSRCSTRRRCSATDGETYVSDPTRAPGESAVFY